MDDFESYIQAIDIDYDSQYVAFTGYHNLNTTQFKVVKRSAYAKSTNYLKEIVEYHGQNVYIPSSVMCFVKHFIDFTKKDYTDKFRDFIRSEKK